MCLGLRYVDYSTALPSHSLQEVRDCYFWVRAPHDSAIGNRKLNCLVVVFGIYCATTANPVAVWLAGGSDLPTPPPLDRYRIAR
jgi:hypothetical protein